MTSSFNGKVTVTEAEGNGRLDAVSNALKKAYELKYQLEIYQNTPLTKVPVPARLHMWESASQTEQWHGERVFTQILFMRPLTL